MVRRGMESFGRVWQVWSGGDRIGLVRRGAAGEAGNGLVGTGPDWTVMEWRGRYGQDRSGRGRSGMVGQVRNGNDWC